MMPPKIDDVIFEQPLTNYVIEEILYFETRFVRGNMDLCKSVSNNFDECSNQDSICDGGSMERTEIKKY